MCLLWSTGQPCVCSDTYSSKPRSGRRRPFRIALPWRRKRPVNRFAIPSTAALMSCCTSDENCSRSLGPMCVFMLGGLLVFLRSIVCERVAISALLENDVAIEFVCLSGVNLLDLLVDFENLGSLALEVQISPQAIPRKCVLRV